MSINPPTVFISYSWDHDDHKTWVRDLANRLTLNGIRVYMDDWDVAPGESLTQFMEARIRECDFTLVICTPKYATRSSQRKGGVGYEQQIISGELVSGQNRRKFIPILREGTFELGNECAIPTHFLGAKAIDMRPLNDRDQAFEKLVRAIFGEPDLIRPPLGPRPSFLSGDSAAVRLATPELDGWHLISGVASNERFRDTFKIPSEAERNSVGQGDLVKLMFEIFVDRSRDEPMIERMWVKISGNQGPYVIGVLDNDPGYLGELTELLEHRQMIAHLGVEDPYNEDPEDAHASKRIKMLESMTLRLGARVVFLPEHILSIYDIQNDSKK